MDVFDEGSRFPEGVVGIPFAVGEHACSADAVFGDPEDLSFGEAGAGPRKLRDRGKETVAYLVGLSWRAVAAGALVDIDFAASDEIIVGEGDWIRKFGRFAADGRVDGGIHEVSFKL